MRILGKLFLAWLHEQGIIPENTRRVVIDARHDSVVVIYTEQYGTDRLIKVEAPPELKTAIVVDGSDASYQRVGLSRDPLLRDILNLLDFATRHPDATVDATEALRLFRQLRTVLSLPPTTDDSPQGGET